MKTKTIVYLIVLAMNGVAFLVAETGSAIINADPVILAFALYGVSHLEYMALKLSWELAIARPLYPEATGKR